MPARSGRPGPPRRDKSAFAAKMTARYLTVIHGRNGLGGSAENGLSAIKRRVMQWAVTEGSLGWTANGSAALSPDELAELIALRRRSRGGSGARVAIGRLRFLEENGWIQGSLRPGVRHQNSSNVA